MNVKFDHPDLISMCKSNDKFKLSVDPKTFGKHFLATEGDEVIIIDFEQGGTKKVINIPLQTSEDLKE